MPDIKFLSDLEFHKLAKAGMGGVAWEGSCRRRISGGTGSGYQFNPKTESRHIDQNEKEKTSEKSEVLGMVTVTSCRKRLG